MRRAVTVHWAKDGTEACSIVASLAQSHGVDEVVKVKSIATDEIDLNAHLAAAGVHALETDLAELIIQLDDDFPSHILVPAIHRNRAEIRDIFIRELGSDSLTDDPAALTEAARLHLRAKFLVGADGGERSELRGGGDRQRLRVRVGGQRTDVHDAAGGARDGDGDREGDPQLARHGGVPAAAAALVDRRADEPVYVVVERRGGRGDGPREFHLVLLDNGRVQTLADEVGRQALRCIRCSACLNVCPVYARVGGHAYGSVYPGPIGAILTPAAARASRSAARCRTRRPCAGPAARCAR